MSASGVPADGDGRRIVTASAQGPAVRVVSQDGAVSAEEADQGRRTVRAGQLSQAAVP